MTRECFLISPIGEKGSPEREHADKVKEHIVEPALEDTDYEVERADEVAEPGFITNQVVQKMIESELVIAVLTDQNANVFYELGVRHAARKPVIQLIDEDQTLPFDVRTQRAVQYSVSDIAKSAEAEEAIVEQLESIEATDSELETPVTAADFRMSLQDSDVPEKEQIEKIHDRVDNIMSVLNTFETKLDENANNQSADIEEDIRLWNKELVQIRNTVVAFEDTLEEMLENEDITSEAHIHVKEQLKSIRAGISTLHHEYRRVVGKNDPELWDIETGERI